MAAPQTKKSIKDGQKLFDLFNRQYFGSRLPRYEIITYEHSPCSWATHGAVCEPHSRRIWVGVENSKDLETVLLHEMAHAAVHPNGNHGPVWQREMIRLRNLGAPIPEEEYKQYANSRASKAKRIIDEIFETIPLNPKMPVKDVVRSIRRSYGLTKPELNEMVCKNLVHFKHFIVGDTIPQIFWDFLS